MGGARAFSICSPGLRVSEKGGGETLGGVLGSKLLWETFGSYFFSGGYLWSEGPFLGGLRWENKERHASGGRLFSGKSRSRGLSRGS